MGTDNHSLQADVIFDGVLKAVELPEFLEGRPESGEMFFAEGLRILSDVTAELLSDSVTSREQARQRLERMMASAYEVGK